MTTLKKYAFALWSILLVIAGVLIGIKFAKPETTIKVIKPKSKRGGSINIITDVDQEDNALTWREKRQQKRADRKAK